MISRMRSGRSMAMSRLIARSGGKLATRCCTSRIWVTSPMVRIRLKSSASKITTRNAGNREGCSVVISGHSFGAVPCAGSSSLGMRLGLRRGQFFVDRQDAREIAEREQRGRSNSEGDAYLAEGRHVGLPVPHAQADDCHIEPVEQDAGKDET